MNLNTMFPASVLSTKQVNLDNYNMYYNKYISNKNAYVNLVGGKKDVNIILVSHNARMRCFLSSYFNNIVKEYLYALNHVDMTKGECKQSGGTDVPTDDPTNVSTDDPSVVTFGGAAAPAAASNKPIKSKAIKSKPIKEIRFKNCCILKLTITNGNPMAELSLVYEGNVSKPKPGAYFVKTETIVKSADQSCKKEYDGIKMLFKNTITEVGFNDVSVKLKDLGIDPNMKFDKYNIYIVRHGEAEHNIKKINLTKDTLLTDNKKSSDDGVRQVVKAAYALNELIGKTKVDYLFCSKLKRTRQTLYILTRALVVPDKMIVMPCTHEVAYKENGKCDESTGIVPFENKMACDSKKAENNIKTKTVDKLNKKDVCEIIEPNTQSKSLIIDWQEYNKFDEKNQCKKTNMIKLIMEYIKVN
jgi:broad specificity phosphatase PhoE